MIVSLRGGFGAAVGFMVLRGAAKAAGIILTAGFMRAAGIEGLQYMHYQGFPEDGRGIIANTGIYTLRNITDGYDAVMALDEFSKGP